MLSVAAAVQIRDALPWLVRKHLLRRNVDPGQL
jgi:hypothetical protein